MGKRLTCFTACFSQSKKKKYQITDKSKKKWEAEIEKYLVEPSIVEKQPSIGVKLPDPLIDERHPPLVVENHPDPLIDEDRPSLISEKRPPLIVEKHPDPLIDEKRTPLSNENHPDPLIDEKHPDPLVDEKHRDPLIDETRPPLIDEKYPNPLVDEKHPGPPIIQKHPPVIDEKHPDPLIDEQHHTLFDTKHQDPLIHQEHLGPSSSFVEAVQSPHFPIEEVKPTEPETEHTKHVCSEEKITSVEPTVVAKVVQELYGTEVTPISEKSEEEVAAAIKIQTVFRGRLARNELQALRGLHRLKTLMDGDSVKHQAKTTLQCMQTLARVQSQIRARRTRMSEENQSLQRQLHQKREQDLEKLRMGDEWDDSKQSKEQIEANLLHKYEAAIKRERARAYAYAHQPTSKIPKSVNPTFMDPKNPHWGWSWLERWMAARPWERNAEKEFIDNLSSGKYELSGEKLTPKVKRIRRPASLRSPSASPSVARSASSLTGKVRPSTPSGDSCTLDDDDTRSAKSMQPVRVRRHSVGSSFRDDGSVTSSPSSVPSYMGSTKSAKAKQSPLGVEKNETPEKGSAVSAKKRLSFSGSLADPRRNSLPPKMTH